jgi:hypothetical protein
MIQNTKKKLIFNFLETLGQLLITCLATCCGAPFFGLVTVVLFIFVFKKGF